MFNDTGSGRVFYAGTALVDGGATCIFRFDTFLFALGALNGGAVYDFNSDSVADLGTVLQGTKTSGIQATGGQVLLSDSGEIGRPPAPPPPPGVPPAPVHGHAAVREHDEDVAGQLGLPAVAAGPVAHPERGGPFSFGVKRPQGYTLREVAYGHPAVPVVRGVRGA